MLNPTSQDSTPQATKSPAEKLESEIVGLSMLIAGALFCILFGMTLLIRIPWTAENWAVAFAALLFAFGIAGLSFCAPKMITSCVKRANLPIEDEEVGSEKQ